LNGSEIDYSDQRKLRNMRAKRIGMIFQEPLTSLNPVMNIADQVIEPLLFHSSMARRDALQRCHDALSEVQIDDPERVMHAYPHQLSGGMRQRVMIAMALICDPDLLIADEPTTALDVTVQAEVCRIIRSLQKDRGLACLFITHDIALAATIADSISVMNEGSIVESAVTTELIARPQSSYAAGLLAAARKREAWKTAGT